MDSQKDATENLGSSRCYAAILEHLQQLVDYVRPEVDGELVEADIVLKELLHAQANIQKVFAELRMLKLELNRVNEMIVLDRFDEGCQRRAFLDLAGRVKSA